MVKKIKKKDNVVDADVTDIIKDSYLQFSISSVNRMVANAIDGLKPSHRRILYTMWKMKAFEFEKSADIVGQSMQLIPHGDATIYDTLVKLAQPERTKYTLVNGQGNIGYINDSLSIYAASRYTEMKMSEYCKDFYFTEDFSFIDVMQTYKGKADIVEPVFLPTLLPMVYIQGTNGITPGYSSRVVPHNLKSVADAYIDFIKNKDNPKMINKLEERIAATMRIDFPTPCRILQDSEKGIITGTGKITVSGYYRIKDFSRGRKMIEVTQLPYLVEVPKFVDQVDKLFRSKDMLYTVRDESSNKGICVQIILRKDIPTKKAEEMLKNLTAYVSSYNYSCIFTKDNTPKRMGVLEVFKFHYANKTRIMKKYLEHQKNELEYRKMCLDGAIFILGNPKRRKEFIQMLTESNNADIIRKLVKKWSLDSDVADYLINKKFSSLLNGIENLLKEQERINKDYEIILSKYNDIDKYLIKEIKDKVKKYEK